MTGVTAGRLVAAAGAAVAAVLFGVAVVAGGAGVAVGAGGAAGARTVSGASGEVAATSVAAGEAVGARTTAVGDGRVGAVRTPEVAAAGGEPPAAGNRSPSSRLGGAVRRMDPGEARWLWPLDPRPRVLRRFLAPVSTYGAGHRGLDLAATPGARVLAVEGGRVTHAGIVAGRGTVTVEHADGLRSTYEPVRPGVRLGDVVGVGDSLGAVQSPVGPGVAYHCGSALCVHLGARLGPAYLDPLPLLTVGRLALLPLGTQPRV